MRYSQGPFSRFASLPTSSWMRTPSPVWGVTGLPQTEASRPQAAVMGGPLGSVAGPPGPVQVRDEPPREGVRGPGMTAAHLSVVWRWVLGRLQSPLVSDVPCRLRPPLSPAPQPQFWVLMAGLCPPCPSSCRPHPQDEWLLPSCTPFWLYSFIPMFFWCLPLSLHCEAPCLMQLSVQHSARGLAGQRTHENFYKYSTALHLSRVTHLALHCLLSNFF